MTARRSRGFTLIEVLVAIVLSAIAMAAILPMLDQVFLRSHEPRTQLDEGIALQTAMENLVVWHTNDLESLRLHVGAEGGSYLGAYPVQDNHYVEFSGGAEAAAGAATNLLKITLRNSLGEASTRLFTKSIKAAP